MADKTFTKFLPPTKAVDLGDGTHAVSAVALVAPAGGTDLVFTDFLPPTKAVDLGDGTYAISAVLQ